MNPTGDRRISWERDSSCTSDSDEEIERWQNRPHEVTTINCNMMVRSLRRVTIKAREIPIDGGAMKVQEIVDRCETTSLEQKQQGAQIVALGATTAQGWNTHQNIIRKWRECRRKACRRFEGQSGVSIHRRRRV